MSFPKFLIDLWFSIVTRILTLVLFYGHFQYDIAVDFTCLTVNETTLHFEDLYSQFWASNSFASIGAEQWLTIFTMKNGLGLVRFFNDFLPEFVHSRIFLLILSNFTFEFFDLRKYRFFFLDQYAKLFNKFFERFSSWCFIDGASSIFFEQPIRWRLQSINLKTVLRPFQVKYF